MRATPKSKFFKSLCLGCMSLPMLLRAATLDSIVVSGITYSNPVLVSESPETALIRHSGGENTFHKSNLTRTECRTLGITNFSGVPQTADDRAALASLTVEGVTYTNPVFISRQSDFITISHSGRMSMLRMKNLSNDALRAFGITNYSNLEIPSAPDSALVKPSKTRSPRDAANQFSQQYPTVTPDEVKRTIEQRIGGISPEEPQPQDRTTWRYNQPQGGLGNSTLGTAYPKSRRKMREEKEWQRQQAFQTAIAAGPEETQRFLAREDQEKAQQALRNIQLQQTQLQQQMDQMRWEAQTRRNEELMRRNFP